MKFKRLSIPDVILCEPQVFGDDRGYFSETFRQDKLEQFLGFNIAFCQDNESKSTYGVLRGLHYQLAPYAQTKLVRVIQGAVLDVAVDIRKNSPTYGQHYSIILSEANKTQFYVPPGFAHGFKTLEDNTIFSYKCTKGYNKDSEGAIKWDDEDLAIDWQVEHPIVSEKDKIAPGFKDLVTQFTF
mgnify:CR=1 FL=1